MTTKAKTARAPEAKVASTKKRLYHEIEFHVDNVTSGAVRYAEVLPDGRVTRNASADESVGAVVGALYIRKTAMPGKSPPQRLFVRIEEIVE